MRQRSPSYSPPRRGYGGRGRSPPRGRYPGRRDDPTSLLVRNIPRDFRAEELRIPFERFGPIKDVYLPKDYYTGEPRGFGFVQFMDPLDAAEAQYHMDHQFIGGREITVVFAEENRKKPEEMRMKGRVRRHPGYGRHGSPYYARSRSPEYHSPAKRGYHSRNIFMPWNSNLLEALIIVFVNIGHIHRHQDGDMICPFHHPMEGDMTGGFHQALISHTDHFQCLTRGLLTYHRRKDSNDLIVKDQFPFLADNTICSFCWVTNLPQRM